jgi:hypothetical protein
LEILSDQLLQYSNRISNTTLLLSPLEEYCLVTLLRSGICATVAFFPVEGVSAPLALFIVSSLPVGFLLFFLWRANVNYRQGKK